MKQHYSSICIFFWLALALFPTQINAQEKPKVDFGGALRFNYNLSSWKEGQKNRGGDFGFDLFRLDVTGSYEGLFTRFEYRFYSDTFGGNFLKEGTVGYNFDEKNTVEFGLIKVPFGIERYNSHNFFFNLPYYVGLEDDYDMGAAFTHIGEKLEYHLGYFKNAEEEIFGDASEHTSSRYAYDIVGRNKEIHQFNAKIVYKPLKDPSHKIGVSGQYGGIYNLDTENIGDRYAFALHYQYKTEDWFIKAQGLTASFSPENAVGESRQSIMMGAFGAPYEVATEFEIYNVGISRILDINTKLVKHIEVYNDFGYMRKRNSGFEDSFMNVVGMLFSSGPVFCFIDYAAGYNHSWLGGDYVDDFAVGDPDAKWEARFNINIGYYF
ncbi:OprO/OprP family phosphate-selective porin [Gramella lutea]|uniref:OprO/OprP family phosphate-selective porin n=1 Tax=Christiangramia lutea TaxID=1607951 RepID=A0A9X2A995_9FLAO|nr:porin [Christiangramia lutea]MCH4823389.1 OprO/OprP family phosphate-selective porin [Christiangramia lutea]